MAVTWQGAPPDWSAPATKADAITKADAVFAGGVVYRALWVGGAGDLTVILADDSVAVVIAAVPAGTLLPVAVRQVSLATTASSIVVLR